MVIQGYNKIAKFAKKHADAAPALEAWRNAVHAAQWQTPNDVIQTFNTADYVGNYRFVFNIRWNRYRIVVAITFVKNTVDIRFVGTHKEYDKINCKTI